ncbi:MAG: hypothetical protein MJ113_07630 [Lachnospiraceae bacterium]|nr:hypothetical protein [Lachnospiraceae bacterium]
MNEDDIRKLLDNLYGMLFEYNKKLVEKSNNIEAGRSTVEIFDLYITSNALGLVKNLFYDRELIHSPCVFMNARNILEGLAIKRFCLSDDCLDINEIILKNQYVFIEYNQYKRFNDIASVVQIPNDLLTKYNETINICCDLLKNQYTKKSIEKIAKMQNPFFIDKDLSYRYMVDKYLGQKFFKLYSQLSWYVHPNDNTYYNNIEESCCLVDILELILEEYSTLPSNSSNLSFWSNILFKELPNYNFLEATINQAKELNRVSSFLLTYGGIADNYVADTLNTIAFIIIDMAYDSILSLSEQVKSKWKTLVETLAVFYYFHEHCDNEYYVELMKFHSIIQKKRNANEEYFDVMLQAFLYYKENINGNCFEQAFRINFGKTLGYLVDSNCLTKTITEYVCDFLNKVGEDFNIEARLMILDYRESQMLSHANGYMWYSNTGAWSENNSIIIGTDICVVYILECISKKYKRKMDEKIVEYNKTTLNLFRNIIKRINLNSEEKKKILDLPRMNAFDIIKCND